MAENVARLRALFPEAFTESGVDFETLRQLLGDEVDDGVEKYGLTWHSKRRARQLALTPSMGTLRPRPEESVDWDSTRNVVIEGDNLEVLKLLQKSYAGKVKLIYIDPPYNTGHDFVYPDNYSGTLDSYLELTSQTDEQGRKLSANPEGSGRFHTDWLNMIYPRLHIARSLLDDKGLICISVDDHESHHLRDVCDEIFGEPSYIGTLTWVNTTQPDNIGRARFGLQKDVEFALLYSKCPRLELPPFILEHTGVAPRYPHQGKLGPCRFEIIERAAEGGYARPTMQFPILGQRPRPGKQWQIGEDTARELERAGKVEVVDGTVKRAMYPEDESGDDTGYVPFWSHLADVPTAQKAKADLKELLGVPHGFDTVKPIELIGELLKHVQNDCLVLDFFAGSGSTAHAVLEANARDHGTRRHILVQLPQPLDPGDAKQRTAAEYCRSIGKPMVISEITKERVRRVGAKLCGDDSLFRGDVGFRVFSLDTSNIRPWSPNSSEDLPATLFASADHLVPGRTEQDVLFELLLKLGLELTVPIAAVPVAGKTVHAVGGGTLLACLAEHVGRDDAEPLAEGIAALRARLAPVGETTVVFRDAAFADDVAKTNLAAILAQRELTNVRSL